MIWFTVVVTRDSSLKSTVGVICHIRNQIPFINIFCIKSLSFYKRLRPNRSFGITKVNKVSKGTKGSVEIFIRNCLHQFDNLFINIGRQMIRMRKLIDNILELGIHCDHILSLIVSDLQSLELVGEQHESFFRGTDDKGNDEHERDRTTTLTHVLRFNGCDLGRDRVEETSFSGIIFATVDQILVSTIEFMKSFVVHVCTHPHNSLTGRTEINRVEGFEEIDSLLGMKSICKVRDIEVKIGERGEDIMKKVIFSER